MQARLLNVCDYPTLVEWWKANRFTPPARDMLPESGTGGIMVSNSSGRDICSGFLFLTNSKVAWMEYIVADKEYKEADRPNAIIFLIEALKEIAKEQGFKYIFTVVNNPHLIKKYEQCGFLTGSNSQEMIISI